MKNCEVLNSAAGIYSVRVNWLWGMSFLCSNVYMLNTAPENGILIIDTGSTGSGRIIANALREAGLSPRDISGIALSHWHKDHTGGAAELIAIAAGEGAEDIKVFIHKEDSRYFPGGKSGFIRFHPFLKIPLYHRPGKIPEAGTCAFVELDNASAHNPLGPWGLEFIHVPGHTPGNISFYHRATGSLFSGSGLAVINSNTAGILSAFTDRRQQIESAKRLMQMDFQYLYPAHLHVCKEAIPRGRRIPVTGRVSFINRVKGILPLFRYE